MSEFKFRIGQRVWLKFPSRDKPEGWVRVVKRTIEAALHKTYLVRNGKRTYGYVPEAYLSEGRDT